MSARLALFAFVLPASLLTAAEPPALTIAAADARLRRAYALAEETNDTAVTGRVLQLRDHVKTVFTRKDVAAAERLVRDAEELVGLDGGGKTMAGVHVSQVGPGERKELDALEERLADAMKRGDPTAVAAVLADMNKVLGDQAGVPDVRKKGESGKPFPVKPADVTDLFVKALEADERTLKNLSAGVPGEGTMPRAYAAVVQGCLLIRPLVEQHQKAKLPVLDDLVRGCCKAMVALQVERGHFKFPDLREKNLRLGAMIDKLVARDPDVVQGGWLVVADPDGSSQVDAGECGIALLRAGAAYKDGAWTKAGRQAADWTATQPTVPTWHYNAASVSLLSEAYRLLGEKKYLDGALQKYRIGVAPGQGPGGRWIDPLNARIAYHVVLVRAAQDVEELLPPSKDREAAAGAARKAIAALLDEAEKLGAPMTSSTVQELGRFVRLHPDGDPRARGVLEQAASAVVQKCSQGGRARAAVPLPELAAASRVWEK